MNLPTELDDAEAALVLDDMLRKLNGPVHRVVGEVGVMITKPAAIDQCAGGELSFFQGKMEAGIEHVRSSCAAAILCTTDMLDAVVGGGGVAPTLVAVDNPRLSFINLVTAFFGTPCALGIHPTATVHPEARLGDAVTVGPYSYVGRASLGDNVVVEAHVYIQDDSKLGNNVTIHAGSVIGTDGFGYERDEKGRWVKFPHLGNVIIEDDVEIGANTCINRATLGSTVIARGAKLDDLVYVAHNVRVGEDAAVVGQSVVSGSATIGDRAWVSPASVVRDKVTVGHDCIIGLGAVVVADVTAGDTVVGNPARVIQRRQGTLD